MRTMRTTYEIVNRLIGPFRPLGDASCDMDRLMRLDEVIDLTRSLFEDIRSVSETIHNGEESIMNARKMAAKFLEELASDLVPYFEPNKVPNNAPSVAQAV